MRSPWFFFILLAALLFFVSHAETQTIGPCCEPKTQTESEDPPPFIVGAEVRRPDERALEANAEEPIPGAAPLASTVALPSPVRPVIIASVPTPVVPVENTASSEPREVSAVSAGRPVVASVNPRAISLEEEAIASARQFEHVRIVEPPPSRVDPNAPTVPDTDSPNTLPCCQEVGETEPPDPHSPGPIFVPAEVKRPDERALEASAEAPVSDETPLADAIAISLEDADEVTVEPLRVPTVAAVDDPPLFDVLSSCCQFIAVTHHYDVHEDPRDKEENRPPPLVTAKVTSPAEREFVAAAEALAEAAQRLGNAIATTEDERLSAAVEPTRMPEIAASPPGLRALQRKAEIASLALLLLLAIGFTVRRRPGRPLRLDDDRSTPPRARPDRLTLPEAPSAPILEPEVALAKARAEGRAREPA